MFTGIVESLARIKSIEKFEDCWKISIQSNILDDVITGDSISVNGVCLTVTKKEKDIFFSDVVSETLNKTNLALLKINDLVNLEKCMKINDRFGGHVVQGHVEGTATIIKKKTAVNETRLFINLNDDIKKYCIYKGSISLDGISLTIANIDDNNIELAIIPHTLKHTTLSFKDVGDILNVETDMFAKYVEKQITYTKN